MPTDRGFGSHSDRQPRRRSSIQRKNSSTTTANEFNDHLCPSSSSPDHSRISSCCDIVPSRRASAAPSRPDHESLRRPTNLSDSNKAIIEDKDEAQNQKPTTSKKKSKTQHKQRQPSTNHPSRSLIKDVEEDQQQQRPPPEDPFSYLNDFSSSSSSSTQYHQTQPRRRRRPKQLQKQINHHSQAAKMGCFRAIILCYNPRNNKDDSPPDDDDDEEEFDVPAPFLPSAVDSMYTPACRSLGDSSNNSNYLDHNNNNNNDNNVVPFMNKKKLNAHRLSKRIESERTSKVDKVNGGGNLLRRTLSMTATSRQGGSRSRTPKRTEFSGPMTFGNTPSSTPSSYSTDFSRSNTPGRRSPHPIMFSTSSGLLKPPQVEFKLQCSLEELCFGCVKQVTISRDIVDFSGQMSHKEEVMTVNVQPGWTKGTKIKFSGSGGGIGGGGSSSNATNTSVTEESSGMELGYYSSDVVFMVEEKKHQFLNRSKTNDEDLEMKVDVSLIHALTGCDLSIPLLGDDQKMCLQIYDIVTPGYEKVIRGQGMPTRTDPTKRGDLRVKFRVEFPEKLEDSKRSEISKILLRE